MARAKELMDGELLNTAFAVYAPDGQTKLTKKARSARIAFGRRSIEDGLRDIADDYPGRKLDEPAYMPDFSSLREAVNVAACDERPLVVVWATDEPACAELEQNLRALAWSPELIGRLHWDLMIGDDFGALIADAPDADHGIIVVQPEPFGRQAHLIGTIDVDASVSDQLTALVEALERFEASFSKLPYQEHVQRGKALGIVWDEAIRMNQRPMDNTRRRRGDR